MKIDVLDNRDMGYTGSRGRVATYVAPSAPGPRGYSL